MMNKSTLYIWRLSIQMTRNKRYHMFPSVYVYQYARYCTGHVIQARLCAVHDVKHIRSFCGTRSFLPFYIILSFSFSHFFPLQLFAFFLSLFSHTFSSITISGGHDRPISSQFWKCTASVIRNSHFSTYTKSIDTTTRLECCKCNKWSWSTT